MVNDVVYFDLSRVKGVIEDFPESEIFIMSGNLKAAKYYEDRIREHTKVKKYIKAISNNTYSMEGWNFFNSIVFLCGYWWENKNAVTFIQHFSKMPKHVIPVTNLPPIAYLKGGDKE